MLKYTLQSGKIVEITLSPVEIALNLYRAILTECKNANVDIKDLFIGDKSFADLVQDNIEAIINIFASEDVMEAIKACCTRVVYNKQKFSMEIFENIENRKDLFPLLQLVALENLTPFFPQLRIVSEILEQSILK